MTLELFGYLGSVLVAVSLMMRNMWYLRWINFAGAGIFSIYGLLIGAWPVFLLNAFITVVDAWYIIQMWVKKDYFSLELLPSGDQIFVKRMVEFYGDDIRTYFPDFKGELPDKSEVGVIFRNQIPVGLFVFRRETGGMIRVMMDYVIPDYRDLKNARYLYEDRRGIFRSQGFHTFIAINPVPTHQAYLQKVGFIKDPSTPDHFIKPI